MLKRNRTRAVPIGNVVIGANHPIVLQSMCATKTTDVQATAKMAQHLAEAGAGLVRIAVDSPKDADALRQIRDLTDANLSVDLQENYRLAETVAPFVDKIRYNPGHLHHSEPGISWKEKVRLLLDIASRNDCAVRIGVNCGSLDPEKKERDEKQRQSKEPKGLSAALESALEHADFLDSVGFTRYCVSIKGSNPETVLAENRLFARFRPDIPLHLGVTEAGMPPEGILKSRVALEPLLAEGIGDTLRVSLTVSNDRKSEEIEAGRLILRNVEQGNIATLADWNRNRLNIISCPSCARVQNEAFIQLAEEVRRATRFAENRPITIAIMGCRVNGPGETDEADLGLWCGPNQVNFKRGTELIGSFSYTEIILRLVDELKNL